MLKQFIIASNAMSVVDTSKFRWGAQHSCWFGNNLCYLQGLIMDFTITSLSLSYLIVHTFITKHNCFFLSEFQY